jgi:hypothetical protein
MFKKMKSVLSIATVMLVIGTVGCKKITTETNINPNVPSSVDPKFLLSSGLKTSGFLINGNPGGGSQSGNDPLNIYMGYWTVSGGYIPSQSLLTYNITTDFGSEIWNGTYINLANYQAIINSYGDEANTKGAIYTAIARIMKAVHFQRLVDTYNNVPYSEALQAGVINAPVYDDAATIYKDLVKELDESVVLLQGAGIEADNPLQFDIMYGGDTEKWIQFANTTKLKILMNLTQTSDGPGYITANLAGLTAADFIGANADATINPAYTNNAGNQQNPLWNDIGFTTTGTLAGNGDYFRANSYGVGFYQTFSDPRIDKFYTPVKSTGLVTGRVFGSTNGDETNSKVSAIGGNVKGDPQTFGTLKSPTQGSVILSSTESLFLQAEAIQRGYLTGDAAKTYQSAVAESFRLLGVANYATAAATYTAQASDLVNFTTSTDKIKTIITQKWAALNTFDPLESWNDWRRLHIPASLPVSIYPGTTATHIPYRLLYPTSEYSFNAANVNAEGTITPDSKIFWMP